MTKLLLLPGLFGSGPGHWQHFWLDDIAESEIVEQANWDFADVEPWIDKVERALEAAGEAYIVAHSLGCILTAKLAERKAASRIKGALLVAPCDLPETEKLHPGTLSFGGMPTSPIPFPSITVGSLDDKYMSLDHLTHYTGLWRSGVRNIGLAGHINIASGFGRWTGGYMLLDLLRQKAKATPRSSAMISRLAS